jgi:hypothetical protein
MEFVVEQGITDLQRDVLLNRIVEKMTLTQLLQKYPSFQFEYKISDFIVKTAFGYNAGEREQGGRPPYLCPIDEKEFISWIIRQQRKYTPVHIYDALEYTVKLRLRRNECATQVLLAARLYKCIQDSRDLSPSPPSRSWINHILDHYHLKLGYSKEMDPSKIFAGTRTKIEHFFNQFGSLISSFPPELIFNADESMLDLKQYSKVLFSEESGSNYSDQSVLEIYEKHVPHISAMFGFSASGVLVKPAIIIPYQSSITREIAEIVSRDECWLFSGNSGWETKETFFQWCICFAHWANSYRI